MRFIEVHIIFKYHEIDLKLMWGCVSKLGWYDFNLSDTFPMLLFKALTIKAPHWLLVLIWFLFIYLLLSSQRVISAWWENQFVDFEIAIQSSTRKSKRNVQCVFLMRVIFIRIAEAPSLMLIHADTRFSNIKTKIYSPISYNSIIYEVCYKLIACDKI